MVARVITNLPNYVILKIFESNEIAYYLLVTVNWITFVTTANLFFVVHFAGCHEAPLSLVQKLNFSYSTQSGRQHLQIAATTKQSR